MRLKSILFFPFLVIASWVLIHLMALLGIFLALAYPLWWLFFPKRTVCLLCRAGKPGGWCPCCRKVNDDHTHHPVNLGSALLNGALILLFSLISIGIVYAESQVLFRMGFPPTPKTVSLIIPSRGQHRLGEIFPMKIEISGVKTPVNTVQADIGFDASKLEAVDVLTTDSFATLFIQKEINNEAGFVRLTGGLPNPGFSADKGLFGTVLFKGKSPGVVKVEFLPSSLVMANDGRGTNVLKDLTVTSHLILAERILEEEEDMQRQLTLKQVVLGESTDSAQMKFYEERNVLGAKTSLDSPKKQRQGFSKISLDKLEAVDRFILTQWGRLLSKKPNFTY